jgi:hypothetical protein
LKTIYFEIPEEMIEDSIAEANMIADVNFVEINGPIA